VGFVNSPLMAEELLKRTVKQTTTVGDGVTRCTAGGGLP
jgi:hypothetical protein